MKCSAVNYNTTDIECKGETGDLVKDRTMFLMKFCNEFDRSKKKKNILCVLYIGEE